MITKRPSRPGRVLVTFSLPAAIWADVIYVVGDFNDWSETANPMRLTDAGWIVTLELEAGRSYQYRYLMNGSEWHNDWQADSYAPNGYGGDNSVVNAPDFGESENPELPNIIDFSRARLARASARVIG